ncbi:MAG: DNA primase [Flavobacterium sp.]|nr:DNA primase [Flavobacterium sp.]
MKKVIVDYAKLTNEILNLLIDKFPDGYDDTNIIRFKNAQNELIEAVEVRTIDTIYLVKVSKKLANRLEKFDDEVDLDAVIEPIIPIKGLDLDDDDTDDNDDELGSSEDKSDYDDDDDDDNDDNNDASDQNDDDDDDDDDDK